MTIPKTITIDEVIISLVEAWAAKENRSFSNAVETLLTRQLATEAK